MFKKWVKETYINILKIRRIFNKKSLNIKIYDTKLFKLFLGCDLFQIYDLLYMLYTEDILSHFNLRN